ncbi:MAG: c-type cytochrome [Myxococcaceae bacterium]
MKRSIIAAVACLTLAAPAFADSAADTYKAKCKSCHGEDGAGKTKTGEKEKIADMSDPAWQKKHTDEDIKTVISEGSKDNKKMKPFKDKLSAEEIDGLVKYIRTLKK